jgi:hypothetical protein
MQLSKMAQYAKAFVAAIAPVGVLVESAVTDNKITSGEWVQIITALVVAFGVLMVPNKADPEDSIKARFSESEPPSRGSSGPLE